MPAGELVFASMPAAVITFASSLGVPLEELLCAAGLTPEALSAPDELVPYESLLGLWALLLQRFPGEPLGLRYARWIPVSVVGVVGHVVRHCETMRQGIAAYARFCRLMDPHLRISAEERGSVVHLVIEHEPRVLAMVEPIEMMVAALSRFTSMYLDGAVRPIEAVFRHARRHPRSLYEEAFGAPVRFEGATTGLIYDARVLDAPLVGADPWVRDYLMRHAEQLLAARAAPDSAALPGGSPSSAALPGGALPSAALPGGSPPSAALPGGAPASGAASPRDAAPAGAPPIDARVRARIGERLDRGDVDQEGIARSLGMSTRSLQRALKDAGTSFSAQLDAVRRERAIDLIGRRDLALQEVAFLLGYGEPRHFYRSFRRWTGTTPGSYRRTRLP